MIKTVKQACRFNPLIREHCRVKGIATGDTSNNKRAAKGATS